MTKGKHLGIWMDHSNAHIMEYSSSTMQTTILNSKFTHEEKEQSLSKSEYQMHNKEQHEEGEYYKKLGDVIKNYDEVILFGPTEAKVELFNTLKNDHHFDKIKILIIQADKMTENQQHAFVRDHFSKS
jgi:hypothetical protein